MSKTTDAVIDYRNKEKRGGQRPKTYTIPEIIELLEAGGHAQKSRMMIPQGVALQFAADFLRTHKEGT